MSELREQMIEALDGLFPQPLNPTEVLCVPPGLGEGMAVRVTQPFLPQERKSNFTLALAEQDEGYILINKEDGRALTEESKSPTIKGWEKELRDKVSHLITLAPVAMPCGECGSYMVNKDNSLECVLCGLAVTKLCSCGEVMSFLRNAKTGGAFWGCGECNEGRLFNAQVVVGSEREQAIQEARDVLTDPLIKNEKAAKKLLALLDKEEYVEKVLSLTLGEETPNGKRTMQKILEDRESLERRKKKRKKAKPRPRLGKTKKAKAPRDSEIDYYTDADALTGEGGQRIEGTSFVRIPHDSERRTPSSLYPHHELKHENLNPVQSAVLDVFDKDCNVVVAASTSAGKTLSAEMIMGDALDRDGRAIFLSPLRAVSQEKRDEWCDPDHPWSDLDVAILTGDYVLTPKKRKELRHASVVVMTSEMLDSKTRRMHSEENEWLRETLVLVVDEAHLLTMKGRGDALECGIMRFTKNNPHARIVLLSATMPNVSDLGTWLTHLNGKPTRIIQSKWRPTKLTVHNLPYEARTGFGSYNYNEEQKRKAAIKLLQQYPDDKWIVFVHSKKAGNQLLRELRDRHEPAEFHSADLDRDKRHKLEHRFRHGDLRVVIATSTLAYGINMPARRVCVLGIHRGLSAVDPIDVIQMFGRAGRVGLDPEGDAYLLLPDAPGQRDEFLRLSTKYMDPGRIRSQMNEVNTLAFHLVAEVAEGDVKDSKSAVKWYERSLAHLQGLVLPEEDQVVSAKRVMQDLRRCGVLACNEAGTYEATQLGRVASTLYYSPFDVGDWASNFRWASENDKHYNDDVVAWALGNVRTAYIDTWLPKEHEGDMGNLEWRLAQTGVGRLNCPPAVLSFHGLLTGTKYRGLKSHMRQLEFDGDRIMQAITQIDAKVLKTLGRTYCETLSLRLQYGCSWQEAELCQIPGVGAKRASALIEAGFEKVEDVLDKDRRADLVATLGQKTSVSTVRGAKEVMRRRGARD